MIEASISAGRIRGETIPGGAVFRGVPFAAPPTGERRYLPPQPVVPWAGVRDCTAFGAACPQAPMPEDESVFAHLGHPEPTDEDCLFLNVWTPAVDGARRPTIVYVHGGGYAHGSGSLRMHDGRAFVRDGVVLITLNYRLHALGFLALDGLFDGAEGTANLGILDQVAALRWVRDNIDALGGDADNVTIAGESAGGMSVGTLLGTPAADGLFRRAILQSGGACHGVSAATARRVAERTLEVLGVAPGDWAALRAVPVGQIVDASMRLIHQESLDLLGDEDRHMLMPFQPAVDGTVRDELPIDRIRAGRAAGVDVMVGWCADEWRLYWFGLPPEIAATLPPPDTAPYLEHAGLAAEDVLAVYAKQRPEAGELDLLLAVMGDHVIGVPAVRLAEAQEAHDANAWLYRFSWPTPVFGGALRACHSLELAFLFDRLDALPGLVGEHPPRDLAASLRGAWARFAATGDPNGGDLAEWPAYDVADRPVMDFGAERRLLRDPDAALRRLWEGVW